VPRKFSSLPTSGVGQMPVELAPYMNAMRFTYSLKFSDQLKVYV
jgi:hypothetical protein